MVAVTDTDVSHGTGHAREVFVLLALATLILVVLVVAVTTGSYATPLAQLRSILSDLLTGKGVSTTNQRAAYVLWVIRIPRLLLSLMVGGSLAISGAAY